jgi:hypothetical protein
MPASSFIGLRCGNPSELYLTSMEVKGYKESAQHPDARITVLHDYTHPTMFCYEPSIFLQAGLSDTSVQPFSPKDAGCAKVHWPKREIRLAAKVLKIVSRASFQRSAQFNDWHNLILYA